MFVKKSMDELHRVDADDADLIQRIPITLILDHVRSMNNVGSVFRTADAFAIEQIFLCGITPQPPHRDINKTALGATETVPWKYFENISSAIESLKDTLVIGVEQVKGSIDLQDLQVRRNQKYALILGNEVDGVSNEALTYCTSVIEIPQFGSKHSLNISVSAGIVCWELIRKLSFNKV
jgi:tRNA G18 (ribose-2'-O)-methylase SpoU